MTGTERYAIAIDGASRLPDGADRRVIFHGINKSGSLAMARVMRDAYFHDQRAHQFFSQYMGTPRHYKDVIAIINHTGRGHAFFVGHQLFEAYDRRPGQLVLTQIRHPLPRMVSVYQWLKTKHETGSDPKSPYDLAEPFPTLEDFVRRGAGRRHTQMDQLAIGFGAGAAALKRKRLPPEELYERAVEALVERVDWFGISEYLEESIYTYAAICGLPSVRQWVRDDRNAGRQMVWELPESTRTLIEDVYEYELRFYQFARDRFLANVRQLELAGDIAAYKRACEPEYKDRLR